MFSISCANEMDWSQRLENGIIHHVDKKHLLFCSSKLDATHEIYFEVYMSWHMLLTIVQMNIVM
jgi:hypothetical protein